MKIVNDLLASLNIEFDENEKLAHEYATKYYNWDIDDFEAYIVLYYEKYNELIS